jgi:uroporphyrinogen decarboxylase
MPGPLLDVLNSKPPGRRPIWLMRQAGRYLPEYRAVRSKAGSFLDLCYAPDLAQEVTLQPLRRFDLDAAILFSDILVVPHAMGLKLAFVENEGPKLQTVHSLEEVGALNASGMSPYFDKVYETVSLVKRDLPVNKTLIGFCGAPWTVASYMIEGGSSDRKKAQAVAAEAPPWFDAMIKLLVQVSATYLIGQIRNGAEAIQIFDSWAGDLPAHLRQRWVAEPIAALMRAVRSEYPDVPVIAFARGIDGGHVELAEYLRPNAVSVEQRVDLGELVQRLPSSVSVQGNLDPELLLGDRAAMVSRVKSICHAVPMNRHIFNLGHGISPSTPPDAVSDLVAAVREVDGGS